MYVCVCVHVCLQSKCGELGMSKRRQEGKSFSNEYLPTANKCESSFFIGCLGEFQ